MTISKKTASKSVHKTKSHATAGTSEEAQPSPTITVAEPKATSATISTAARTALNLISQAQKALPLTPGLGVKAHKNAVKMQMLPSDLMTEAANFLATNGASYPLFDGGAIQGAVQLEARCDGIKDTFKGKMEVLYVTGYASSSAMLATLRELAPRLAAWAAKSTRGPSGKRLLNEAPPQLRCKMWTSSSYNLKFHSRPSITQFNLRTNTTSAAS